MTTTHTFQGLNADNKPSSRVLNPPGGSSSNIFGNDAQSQPRNPARKSSDSGSQSSSDVVGHGQNAAVAQKPRASRNAFNPITGEPYEQSQSSKPDLKKSTSNASVTTSNKTETGSSGTLQTAESLSSDTVSGQVEHQAPATDKCVSASQDQPQPVHQEKGELAVAAQPPQHGRNQHSGIFGGAEEAKEHRSTRVSQPPGGRSTKLW